MEQINTATIEEACTQAREKLTNFEGSIVVIWDIDGVLNGGTILGVLANTLDPDKLAQFEAFLQEYPHASHIVITSRPIAPNPFGNHWIRVLKKAFPIPENVSLIPLLPSSETDISGLSERINSTEHAIIGDAGKNLIERIYQVLFGNRSLRDIFSNQYSQFLRGVISQADIVIFFDSDGYCLNEFAEATEEQDGERTFYILVDNGLLWTKIIGFMRRTGFILEYAGKVATNLLS